MQDASTKETYARRTDTGFTIVELVIAMLVATIILVSVVGFIIAITNQHVTTSIRSNLTNSLTTGGNRISQDIRSSINVLSQNAITDAAAPATPGYWQSQASQLVLATTARRTNGESLDGTYPGYTDNVVYYLRNGSLYRRLLAYDDGMGNNRYTTITCTPEAGGGCDEDTQILDNVSTLSITYYEADGSVASQADQVRSMTVSVELSVQQSGTTISASSEFTSSLF